MGWNSLGGVAGRHHRHSVRHTAFSVDAERNRGVPLLLLPLSLVSEGSSSPSDHRVNTRGRREKGVALARTIHILAYLLTGPFHKSSYCYRMYSVVRLSYELDSIDLSARIFRPIDLYRLLERFRCLNLVRNFGPVPFLLI